MERGVCRNDLLHPHHRLLLRGADDCANESQPSCPAARRQLFGPEVSRQATAVVNSLFIGQCSTYSPVYSYLRSCCTCPGI